MVKKIKKYVKFMVCMALIAGLIAPSYAALSASDGSAFVTKAEFDAALSDFNARLTTFEAGINSKIDSQVSSYLDRNGIWNGKEVVVEPEYQAGVFTFKRWKSGISAVTIPYFGLNTDKDLFWYDAKYFADPTNEEVVVNGVRIDTPSANDAVLVQALPKSGLLNFYLEQRSVLCGPERLSSTATWADSASNNLTNGTRQWIASSKDSSITTWNYDKSNKKEGRTLDQYEQNASYINFVAAAYGVNTFYPWEIGSDTYLLTQSASAPANTQFSIHQTIIDGTVNVSTAKSNGTADNGPFNNRFLHVIPYQEYKFFFVQKGDKLLMRQNIDQIDIWGKQYTHKNILGLGVGMITRLSNLEIY